MPRFAYSSTSAFCGHEHVKLCSMGTDGHRIACLFCFPLPLARIDVRVRDGMELIMDAWSWVLRSRSAYDHQRGSGIGTISMAVGERISPSGTVCSISISAYCHCLLGQPYLRTRSVLYLVPIPQMSWTRRGLVSFEQESSGSLAFLGGDCRSCTWMWCVVCGVVLELTMILNMAGRG